MSEVIDRLNAALEGSYRVEREIGEGGMATVYIGDDLKHERKVALKVLKPELAAMVGAKRFLAEIKTTANLQHPHILPLFDSGEADGFLFFVMPYIDGETLRERIDREQQLTVDEAVRIATAVANALQVAHDAGIVHRDIKPGNILLSGGEPLVADFGISMAVSDDRLTQSGIHAGTPRYMSPEQATGDHEIGAATDTYSLGCVLYEMLVGEPPFSGRTTQAVLAKIIQGDPVSVTSVRKSLPPNVDAAIRKALERIPAERFATVKGLADALNNPSFRYGRLAGDARAQPGMLNALSAVALALAVVFAGIAAWALLRAPPPAQAERYEFPFRRGQGPVDFGPGSFALLPDGSALVYRGPSAQASARLWVRRWSELESSVLRETEGAVELAVSPDGHELAFASGGAIRVVPLSGGPVRTLTPGFRPLWGDDGYVYAGTSTGVARAPDAGGDAEVIASRPSPDVELSPAELLPGRRLLVTMRSAVATEIGLVRIDDGQLETLTAGSSPRFVDGRLVYLLGGNLVAAEFDPRRPEAMGPAVPLIDGVMTYSLSSSGRLVYSTAPETGTSELVWIDRRGQVTPVDPGWSFNSGGGGNIGWSLSPDGTRLAMRRVTAGSDIWIKELDDGPLSRLTLHPADDRAPRWTPDGRTVTFLSDRATDLEVWTKPADGTGEAERLFDYEGRIAKAIWSPDGTTLVLRRSGLAGGSEGERDILIFRPGVDDQPVPLVASPDFAEQAPALSPDGRWLAYSSDETGRNEIFVRPFPDVEGGKWMVSTEGGILPVWSRDGTELFFVEDGPRMVAAHYTGEPTFEVTDLERLFEIPPGYPVPQNGDPYDVTPDGQRFVMARVFASGPEELQRVVMVTNFLDDLRRVGGD